MAMSREEIELRRDGPPPARPNTASNLEESRRALLWHDKDGVSAAERHASYMDRLRSGPPPKIPSKFRKMGGGMWSFSTDVANRMLWREFGGRQFVWTYMGRANLGLAIAGLAGATYAVGDGVHQVTKDVELTPDVKRGLDQLAKNLGIPNVEMQTFAVEVGLASLPLINTVLAGGKLALSAASTVSNVRGIYASKPLVLPNAQSAPLFDLARSSLVDCLTGQAKTSALDIGGYTVDLVLSLVVPLMPLLLIKKAADLGVGIKRLKESYDMVQRINDFLASKDPKPDVLAAMKQYPLLACYLFTLQDPELSGHLIEGTEHYTDQESIHLLRLLGLDKPETDANSAKIAVARKYALSVVNDRPYRLAVRGATKENERANVVMPAIRKTTPLKRPK